MKAESELHFIQQALAAAKEAYRKVEEEICRITNDRLSLIMEVGVGKEELSTFPTKETAQREVMKAEFDASSDVIFNYGYGCCDFVHDICGSKPMILAGMPNTTELLPLEFFINPRCPPSASFDPPGTPNVREELRALSPLAAVDGTKVSPESPAKLEGEFDVPADC